MLTKELIDRALWGLENELGWRDKLYPNGWTDKTDYPAYWNTSECIRRAVENYATNDREEQIALIAYFHRILPVEYVD